ncbi:MAG: class I SAM-dependent methyltransferase [Chitinophagales bacterium]|nr:class I SAM-dependent methyltransferase [Chitinophagales bacterium]
MDAQVHYTACPVCGGHGFQPVFSVHDHTVSQEDFLILGCTECGHRFTQDVPGPDRIGAYYKAESYISHTNSSKGLINRMYKIVRGYTIGSKRRWVEKYTGLKKGAILDIGAGTGFFIAEMKSNGWVVTGLEPDAEARAVAFDTNGLKLEGLDTLYQLTPGTYDAITLWHVLEHVHDLEGYVKRFNELLKPEGRLIIAVPNHTSHDARKYGKDWAAYDVPRHLHHFSPSSMKHLLEERGFLLQEMRPMYFDAFYVSLLSSKYKSGKTTWLSAFLIAFVSNIKAFFHREKCSSITYIFKQKANS